MSELIRRMVVVGAALFMMVGQVMAQDKPQVAVIPFDNRTDWWTDGMGDVAADLIVTGLVNSGAFTVIERERFEAILDE